MTKSLADTAILAHLHGTELPLDTALASIGLASVEELDASVGEIIESYHLQPFVEAARRTSQDADKQCGIAANDLVLFNGKLCRTLLCRKVKGRTRDYEFLLQDRHGEDVGFAPASEIETLTGLDAATLAEKYRADKLDFDEGLQLLLFRGDAEPDFDLFLAVKLAIGFANMGKPNHRMALPDGRRMTARNIVKKFGLEPFLEDEAKDG